MRDTFQVTSEALRPHDWADPSRCLFFWPELACFADELGTRWHCFGCVDTTTIRKLFQAARQLGGYSVRVSEKQNPLGSDYYPIWIARDGTRKDNSPLWGAVREMEL